MKLVWNTFETHIKHVVLEHLWHKCVKPRCFTYFTCDFNMRFEHVICMWFNMWFASSKKKTLSASALFPYLDKYIVWLQKTWNTVHRSYRQPFWHFYSVLLAYLELGSKNQHQFLLLEKEQLSLTPHFVLHRRRKIIWGREWHERKLWCSFS